MDAAITHVACRTRRFSLRSRLDQVKRQIGFDLIFVTTANTDNEGRELLTELGMPFRDVKKADEAELATA